MSAPPIVAFAPPQRLHPICIATQRVRVNEPSLTNPKNDRRAHWSNRMPSALTVTVPKPSRGQISTLRVHRSLPMSDSTARAADPPPKPGSSPGRTLMVTPAAPPSP